MHFDALGLYLPPGQLIQFYRQAAELDFKPVTFGTTPFENRTVLGAALKLMDGACMPDRCESGVSRALPQALRG